MHGSARVLRMFLFCCCCSAVLAACAGREVHQTRSAGFGVFPADCRQLVLVLAADWDSPTGVLRRFESAGKGAPWVEVGQAVAVNLGRSGLGWGHGVLDHAPMPYTLPGSLKTEGDGRAPAGIFRLPGLFAYNPVELAATGLPVLGLDHAVAEGRPWYCVDDKASRSYNRLVQGEDAKDWKSAETMRRDDDLYRFGALVAHNTDRITPGAGSCIFLHVERGPGVPTAGCTSMPAAAMVELARWLDAKANPLLVQLPQSVYRTVRRDWSLP